MHPLVAVWKTVPCPNPHNTKVASSRRMNYTATNPRTFSALLRMYGVIDRSHALAVAFSRRFTSFMLWQTFLPL